MIDSRLTKWKSETLVVSVVRQRSVTDQKLVDSAQMCFGIVQE